MKNLIDSILTAIRDNHEPVKVLPSPDGNGEIHVLRDGEKWRETHITGPKARVVEHAFTDLSDFCAFIADRHESSPCDVLVDGSSSSVTCHTSPGERYQDMLTLSLVTHPACKAWLGMAAWKTQQQVVEHLRGFGGAVTDDGGADFLLSKFLTLKLTAKEEWVSEVDSKGRTVVQSASRGEQMSVTLPDVVNIEIPWFRGVEIDGEGCSYACELLLSMDKDDKGRPIFKFTMPSRPLVEHSALCDVSDALRQGLVAVTGCRVGQGRAKTQIVPRLG